MTKVIRCKEDIVDSLVNAGIKDVGIARDVIEPIVREDAIEDILTKFKHKIGESLKEVNQPISKFLKINNEKFKESFKEYSGQLQKELDDIIKNYQSITTSDLQGILSALARKFGKSDDELLDYVYNRVIKSKESFRESVIPKPCHYCKTLTKGRIFEDGKDIPICKQCQLELYGKVFDESFRKRERKESLSKISNKRFKESLYTGDADYICPHCKDKFKSTDMFAYKGKCPKCGETLRAFFKSYKAIGSQDKIMSSFKYENAHNTQYKHNTYTESTIRDTGNPDRPETELPETELMSGEGVNIKPVKTRAVDKKYNILAKQNFDKPYQSLKPEEKKKIMGEFIKDSDPEPKNLIPSEQPGAKKEYGINPTKIIDVNGEFETEEPKKEAKKESHKSWDSMSEDEREMVLDGIADKKYTRFDWVELPIEITSKIKIKTNVRESFIKKEMATPEVTAFVVDFLEKNPDPTDDQVHKWAEEQGLDIHEVEENIYAIASKKLAEKYKR